MFQRLHALFMRSVQPIIRLINRPRFVASIRPSDVFIVTYPKSGTRWIGFFLASIFSMKISGRLLATINYGDYVRDINFRYFRSKPLDYRHLPEPRVFTVHVPWDPDFPNVIYLVRDPRAVLVSFYHHHRAVNPRFNLSLSEFIIKNQMWPCDWGEHVNSWLTHRREEQKILLVRYEDLHRDSLNWFSKILEFCNLHVSEEELISAIESSRFENMRYLEEQANLHYANLDLRFMRKGQIDIWREELSDELVKLIEDRYRVLMDSLGYECTYTKR